MNCLIAITLLAAGLLILCRDSELAAQDRRAGTDPLKLIPVDSLGFVQLRFKQMHESSASKLYAAKAQKSELEEDQFHLQYYGVKLEDIESETGAWTKPDRDSAVNVIVTLRPYDRARVKAIVEKGRERYEAIKRDSNEKTPANLRQNDLVNGHEHTVYFLGPDTLVYAKGAAAISDYVDASHERRQTAS